MQRAGNLWVQSGTTARQITESVNGSQASQPAFSPDGQWIYYIDTRVTTGKWYNPDNGDEISDYTLYYPVCAAFTPTEPAEADVLSGLMQEGLAPA
jgi:Tol biopolymer transport system component